jgi:hypothetical protein
MSCTEKDVASLNVEGKKSDAFVPLLSLSARSTHYRSRLGSGQVLSEYISLHHAYEKSLYTFTITLARTDNGLLFKEDRYCF